MTGKSPAIRLATPADAEALARLRYEFRVALGEPNETEDAFVARCASWMRVRLAARPAAWRAWVACLDGVSVGCIWVQVIEKVPNPVPEPEAHAYLTNLYVRPECRGGGTGARLFETALAWCREQRVHVAVLWPTARSRSLYARHGFGDPDDMMVLRLARGFLGPQPR